MQQVHVLCELKNASLTETMRCPFCLLDWQSQKQTTNNAVFMGWRPAKRIASQDGTTHHQIFYRNSGKRQKLASVPTAMFCFVVFLRTFRIIFCHKKSQTIRLGGDGKCVFQDER